MQKYEKKLRTKKKGSNLFAYWILPVLRNVFPFFCFPFFYKYDLVSVQYITKFAPLKTKW